MYIFTAIGHIPQIIVYHRLFLDCIIMADLMCICGIDTTECLGKNSLRQTNCYIYTGMVKHQVVEQFFEEQ